MEFHFLLKLTNSLFIEFIITLIRVSVSSNVIVNVIVIITLYVTIAYYTITTITITFLLISTQQ